MPKKIDVFEVRGNVFADIGLPNPEERLAKASLAIRIAAAIRARKLTQAPAWIFKSISPGFRAYRRAGSPDSRPSV